MRNMRSLGTVLTFFAAALSILALVAEPADAQNRRLSIGTADTGGVYYIYGGGIAKTISANIPNTQATAEVTPGAVDNVKMLQNQSLDFAFTKSDVAAEGIKGVGPFAATGKVPVRALAVLYPDIAHVVVVRVEEPELQTRMGASYREYCARVPRWLPRLRRPAPGAPER